MSDFLEDMAYRQYDSQLPKRYDRKPVCTCKNCGEDMFLYDKGTRLNGAIYCNYCAKEITITEEEIQ